MSESGEKLEISSNDLFEVCAACDNWRLYHRAEDDQCPIPPIYEADTVTKRRQFGTTYFAAPQSDSLISNEGKSPGETEEMRQN